ncbi:hypothetical protein L6164_012351 [Bauhinia variegata]|uniref:Uncharacterized protein n=1 Tax=Bauhinia variegata TaxID=167791 RepID=A0ACB9P9U4_BAUVA|nr:hypothetical protein L6164_012351 [Bauhinia variegata]
MSSRYPILENRPIDQWKVTELKEELKRRKLKINGLKDDLIKRLDEALRIEREAAEAAKKDEVNGFECGSQPVVALKDSQTVTVDVKVGGGNAKIVDAGEKENTATVGPIKEGKAEKIPETVVNDSIKNDSLDSVTIAAEVNNSVPAMVLEVEGNKLPAGLDSESVGKEFGVLSSTLESSIMVTECVSTEVVVSGQESYNAETRKDNGDSATKQDNEESKSQLEIEESKSAGD